MSSTTVASETATIEALKTVEERILQDQQYLSGIGHNLKMTGTEPYLSNRYFSAANQLSRALNSVRERINKLDGSDYETRLYSPDNE